MWTRHSFALSIAAGLLMAVVGCQGRPQEAPIDPTPTPSIPSVLEPKTLNGKFTFPAMPQPPISIAAPLAPPSDFQGQDLTKIDGERLGALANQAYSEGRYAESSQLQHWSVANGAGGRYNLACYQAMADHKEAAFYWLQEAAIKDGVNAAWAVEDSDLASLHSDPRWRQVASFLRACNASWATSGHSLTTLILPKDYQPGTAIGVVVGMHGMGSSSTGFVDENVQSLADDLGMAFVGVSGTVPLGPHAFIWSEDVDRDADQIRRALREVSGRVKIDPAKVVTYGFSQGAQMAFEVSIRYPDEFRGAIVMSPGTTKRVNLSGLLPVPAHRSQGYVLLCGAGEHPGNIANTNRDADFVQKTGARMELRLEPGQDRHTFPADFYEKFPSWVRLVRDTPDTK